MAFGFLAVIASTCGLGVVIGRYTKDDRVSSVGPRTDGAATTAAGIGHGFYYSLTNNFFLNVISHQAGASKTLLPGQVNVSQAEFEAIALAQVTELWTEYGNLTEIW